MRGGAYNITVDNQNVDMPERSNCVTVGEKLHVRGHLNKRLLYIPLLSIILLFILLIVVFFSAMPTHTTLTWSVQIIDSANIGEGSSIALDSGDNPHISYCGFVNGENDYCNLKYACWNGSSWSIQTVDPFGNNGFHSSIALNSQGYPHISYYTNTYYNGSRDHLKYAMWNGSAWSIQTIDANVGDGSSIAVDSANNPHISYHDKNGGLKYAKWADSTWLIQTVDSAGFIEGDKSLVLDSKNNLHIVYSNDGVKYAKWNGSEWAIQTVVSGGAFYSSIALDSKEYPHISYCNLWSDGYLNYAHWTGTAWSTQTVDSTNKNGRGNSIALDSNDNLHISCSYTANNILNYAKWSGSAWSIQTVNSSDVWSHTSIALDSNNNPHISFLTNPSGGFIRGGLNYATPAISTQTPKT